MPYAQTADNSFENLIALCPNDHTRYDQTREIDRMAVRMYKQNLGILNNRYGEFERRVFAYLAETGSAMFMVGAGGDLLVANAVKDGLFADTGLQGMSYDVQDGLGGEWSFNMNFVYQVTPSGQAFIERYRDGQDIT